MLNKDEQNNFLKIFEATFGHLLNEFMEDQEDTQGEDYEKEENDLEGLKRIVLSSVDNFKSTQEEPKKFESKQTLPPLSDEQETRAISIGLQEIQKMKEYLITTYNHQTSELTRVYASYPLLFAKKFDEIYAEAHQKIWDRIVNSEHFIAGNFHNIEAVNNNLRLVQPLKERRLSVLYSILAFYDSKK